MLRCQYWWLLSVRGEPGRIRDEERYLCHVSHTPHVQLTDAPLMMPSEHADTTLHILYISSAQLSNILTVWEVTFWQNHSLFHYYIRSKAFFLETFWTRNPLKIPLLCVRLGLKTKVCIQTIPWFSFFIDMVSAKDFRLFYSW